jgi:hypothetical protein
MEKEGNFNWKVVILTIGASIITAGGTVYGIKSDEGVAMRQSDTDRLNHTWTQMNLLQEQARQDRYKHSEEIRLLRAENASLREQFIETRISLVNAQIQIIELEAALKVTAEYQAEDKRVADNGRSTGPDT